MRLSEPERAESGRVGFTLAEKFGLGVASLLVVVSLVYSALAYVAMRRSAVGITRTRLGVVADQFAQLLTGARARLTKEAELAAQDGALAEFLATPNARTQSRALAVLRTATDSGPLRIGVQLWDATPKVVLSDGRVGMLRVPTRIAPLLRAADQTGSAVVGPLTAEHDSLFYPIVVSVAAAGRPLGYVVAWRHMAALPGTRDQLRALLGRATQIYVGSRGGTGWTDLEHAVSPPPVSFDSTRPILSYTRPGVGLVYATPRLVPGTPFVVVVEQTGATVLAEVNHFLSEAALFGLAVLLASLVGTVILSRRLTTPIVRITDAAARVAAGDYSTRSDAPYSSDELGRLARSFDTMVDRVRESVEAQRMAERRSYQAQKMEAVGQLASGLAHDFNNLLTIIISYGDLLMADVAADAPQRADVEAIRSAAFSASQLTRQLLIFSRQQVVQPQDVRLATIVVSTAKLLKPVLGDNIELVISADAESGYAKLDPGQIEQIIVNLAVNARDAMPDGGRLIIETKNVEFFGTTAEYPPPYPAGKYVSLFVTDSGTGMNQETLSRAFEPFFTTKAPGVGTGLGLATVYGIVKQSGGYISVYSEPGEGATFKMFFPRTEHVEEVRVTSAPSDVPRGTETVFVVEDQPAVRNIVRLVLERQGYRVLEAPNGQTALDLAAKSPGAIDLLITDVVMPQMGGRAVADRLSVLRPVIKVLFISGYTADTVLRQEVLAHGVEYLEKPFGPDALARKVRQVLDSKTTYRGAHDTGV